MKVKPKEEERNIALTGVNMLRTKSKIDLLVDNPALNP
jgi:hypothetical protein